MVPRNKCPGDSGTYRNRCPGGHFVGVTTMHAYDTVVGG